MTQLDYTLGECLSDCGLRELPSEWNPDTSTLVDGIALVTKVTGKEYCKVANKDGKVAVVRDYGKCAAILKVERIFAVNTITKADIPKFANSDEIIHFLSKSVYDRDEIIALLNTDNKTESQIIEDRAEIDRRIQKITLEHTKRKKEEEKRVKKIREYADKAKADKAQNRRARKKKE